MAGSAWTDLMSPREARRTSGPVPCVPISLHLIPRPHALESNGEEAMPVPCPGNLLMGLFQLKMCE